MSYFHTSSFLRLAKKDLLQKGSLQKYEMDKKKKSEYGSKAFVFKFMPVLFSLSYSPSAPC